MQLSLTRGQLVAGPLQQRALRAVGAVQVAVRAAAGQAAVLAAGGLGPRDAQLTAAAAAHQLQSRTALVSGCRLNWWKNRPLATLLLLYRSAFI